MSEDLRSYRYMRPMEACQKLKLTAIGPSPYASRCPPESHAEVGLKARVGKGGLAWTIDQDGTEVPGTRIPDDTYRLNPERFPDPDTVELSDLPPVVTE